MTKFPWRSWTLGLAVTLAAVALAEPGKPVVLFDGTTADAFFEKQWQFRDGLLVGQGMLRTLKRYNNFEMRIRYRNTEAYAPIRFADAVLPEGFARRPSRKLRAAQVGQWRDLRVLVRGMPDEQVRVENLTPLADEVPAVTYGGKALRFTVKNDRPDEDYKLRDDGFVPDGGRIDLFFDEATEIASLSLLPLSPTSPRDYLALAGDELAAAVAAGGEVYKVNCLICHGDGVGKAPNPLARSFATDPIANGADLHGIWRTLTNGFRNMPPMASLSTEQRYQVAHYVREKILKPNNPKAYVPVTEAYLAGFPHPLYTIAEKRVRANKSPLQLAKESGRYRDHGPAMVCTNKGKRNALQVKLAGEMTISYNLHTMASLGVWHGSFMEMTGSHYFVGKGHRQPTANGTEVPELGTWKWAHGGKINYPDEPDNGPMTTPGFRFNGYWLHEDRAVVAYQFENRQVLEMPEAVVDGESRVLIQHLEVVAGDEPVSVAISDKLFVDGVAPPTKGAVLGTADWALALVGDLAAVSWGGIDNHFAVTIPASDKTVRFAVVRGVGKDAHAAVGRAADSLKVADFAKLMEGGERRWPEAIVGKGTVAADDAPYVVDTLPVPETNPYNAWMRTTSLAFFDDGRAAVTTYDGDVWIVSGIDRDLQAVSWSRFAAGMHEAFGCQIVDGQIYVGTRNGIVRLHDRNADGEADFYEQFFCDPDFSFRYHGYNFDLVRDAEGNFYYAKNGQFTDISYDGGCLKIAPDGKSYEIIATGFRTPNGMGILPDGRLLFGDNQGSWVPAGKLSIIKPGKWYGGAMPHGQKAPTSFELPILWLPQEVDNSCGGQVWVEDKRFGPYGEGALLHTSCGSGRAMMVFMDEVGGKTQAAVQRFPQVFESGVMRPRMNPRDGQVYLTGTRGWGVKSPKDGCLQRLRFTGDKSPVLTAVRARPGRLVLDFSAALPAGDPELAEFAVEQWNYLWSRTYGSKKYSVKNPKMATPDRLAVAGVTVSDDRRQLTVAVPELGPADQVRLQYRLPQRTESDEIHLTIHTLAEEL